jgi:RHS repeat-associated protein
VVTSATGSLIGTEDFALFGEGGVTGAGSLQFTGHERDWNPAGGSDPLDYMHARFYTAPMGRFLSVDRHLGNLLRPQSWNRYAYVLNNPMNLVDPNGLDERNAGEQMGTDDTCNGTVVDGWCTGETITVTAKAPEIDWASLSAGFGDGIIGTLTFGIVGGAQMDKARKFFGGDPQIVDRCSGEYLGGRVAGTAVTMAAYAYGAVPATLTHVTTEAGVAGMEAVGSIFPSTATYMGGVTAEGGGIVMPSTGATLFGDGVYATAGSGALVPGGSSIPMTVGGQGFMRVAGNAAFLNGGSALTAGWAAG